MYFPDKNNPGNLNDTCIGIVIFAFLLWLGCGIFYIRQDKAEMAAIRASDTRTIGTIREVYNLTKINKRQVRQKVVAEYDVNGKKYMGTEATDILWHHAGEHFEIMYDSKNPETFRIDFEKPVFLKGEITDIATGEIIESNTKLQVAFTFRPNGDTTGNTYIIYQVPNMYVFSPGDTCTVQYLVSDPNIAVIKKPF